MAARELGDGRDALHAPGHELGGILMGFFGDAAHLVEDGDGGAGQIQFEEEHAGHEAAADGDDAVSRRLESLGAGDGFGDDLTADLAGAGIGVFDAFEALNDDFFGQFLEIKIVHGRGRLYHLAPPAPGWYTARHERPRARVRRFRFGRLRRPSPLPADVVA